MKQFDDIRFQELKEGLYDPNIFKAFFLAGGPGSGKSNIGKGLQLGRDGWKVVNQDIFIESEKAKQGLPQIEKDYTKEQRSKRAKIGAAGRKAAEATSEIEVWGDGQQTRSFLYIDECIEAVLRFMRQEKFYGPVNIGSEEMVTINQLAQMAIDLSGKNTKINNLDGKDFFDKYGFEVPLGVKGRNSDNKLFKEKMGWEPTQPLIKGMEKTYEWINTQVANSLEN